MEQLYKIKKSDINKAAETLSTAFNQYPLYVPVITDAEKRKKFLHELKTLFIKVTLRYGNVYATSPAMEGVVLYKDEKQYNSSLWKIISSGGIINVLRMARMANFSEVKRVFNATSAIESVHKAYNIDNNGYLEIVAVKPEMQGQKLASKLINKVLSDCKAQNKGCYIETASPKNVKIYQKFGFILMEEKTNNANGADIYYLHYPRK